MSAIDRHCHVFPVRVWTDAAGKHHKAPAVPRGTDWHTYAAPADELAGAPNVGIVIPDGIAVIDLDTYRQKLTLADLDAALGCRLEWALAALQKTVSGGFHFAFSLPQNVTIRQGANVCDIGGLDTRAAGKGWICTGEGYQPGPRGDVLAALNSQRFPALPEPARRALAEPVAKPAPATAVVSPRGYSVAPALSAAEGSRNDTLMRAGVWFAHHGFGGERVLSELLDRNAQSCTPPLPEAEVRKIAKSVMRYWEPRAAGQGARRHDAGALTTDRRWAARLPRRAAA